MFTESHIFACCALQHGGRVFDAGFGGVSLLSKAVLLLVLRRWMVIAMLPCVVQFVACHVPPSLAHLVVRYRMLGHNSRYHLCGKPFSSPTTGLPYSSDTDLVGFCIFAAFSLLSRRQWVRHSLHLCRRNRAKRSPPLCARSPDPRSSLRLPLVLGTAHRLGPSGPCGCNPASASSGVMPFAASTLALSPRRVQLRLSVRRNRCSRRTPRARILRGTCRPCPCLGRHPQTCIYVGATILQGGVSTQLPSVAQTRPWLQQSLKGGLRSPSSAWPRSHQR